MPDSGSVPSRQIHRPPMNDVKLKSPEPFSLFEHEEGVIRQADDMIHKLEEVTGGLRSLAEAYRYNHREVQRLVRMSDRLQFDLQKADRAHASQARELQALNQTLITEVAERKRLAEELRRIAIVDEMTGLNTRRHLLELGEHEHRRQQRNGLPMSVLLMDLDHFKRVNDIHGHAAGDETLRRFGAALRACMRKTDIFGRFGGEEFLALLPETALEVALTLAERVRRAVEAMKIDWQGSSIRISVSIGAASLEAGEPLERAIARADTALYQAKDEGRNRVAVQPPPQTGEQRP